ncbi:uncharacterized protein LOC115088596 [Rhinatrema bivittatum]|uniref:uncharacterized protein LOC115088596 n=1 Tax=Rhinatrema bivittatum TaxID=194408 RepID=UPI00112DACAF|nr:uncharacterized protein LOC115088596 [Rhinatrema bivittatum]
MVLDMLHTSVIVYFDNVLVYSKDLFMHHIQVRQVLQKRLDNHLYAKLEKCQFEQESLLFLGYIVSSTGFHMDPDKVAAIQDWPQPVGLKALQCFLGFANFYRQFIPHYSWMVAPLTALTRKGADAKNWFQMAISAFQRLKEAFFLDLCFHHPNLQRRFIVEVDTSMRSPQI